MRFAAYAGASVALATGVVLKALHQRANFYAACVYLSQSSANLMILTNLCLLVTGYFLFWLQRLLYGPLRAIETEQLYEKAWFAVTETCLAMTIFRGELGGRFLVMFVCLLVGKVWGWIGEGRVEYLEQQPPTNPRLFHTRLATSLILSVLFNSYMLEYCVQTVLEQARPDMMVMFGFEFAVLTVLSTSTAARYAIALVEILITRQQVKAKMEERRAEIRARRDEMVREHARAGASGFPDNLPDENDVNEMEIDVPGWEDKGRWVFYLDLVTDFVKLVVYLAFFFILFAFYGLPIHILRDVLITIRSFGRRIMDFLRYRTATRDMNDRYPDATAEEVAREDVCIICREEMTPWQPAAGAEAPAAGGQQVPERLRPKKLPCGHILHFSCLRSWLERQQNCPTCRRPVVVPSRNHAAFGPGAGINAAQGLAGPGIQPNQAGANQLPGANGAAPDGAARARVYQFGPFRIGFGAGRGDLFQNLHQRVHQPNAPLPHRPNGNAGGARQIGFGLGFGRRPVPPANAPANMPPVAPSSRSLESIDSQLEQIARNIQMQLDHLNTLTQQMRLFQLEMEILRLQAQVTGSAGAPAGNAGSAGNTGDSSQMWSSPASSAPARLPFVSDPHAPATEAGDARLPEGLTLPPGWTLTPLYQPQQGSSSVGLAQPSLSAATAAAEATSSGPAGAGTSTVTGTAVNSTMINETGRSDNISGPSGTITSSQANPANPPSHMASAQPTPSHRAESPSQEWTELSADGPTARIDEPPAWAASGSSSVEQTKLPNDGASPESPKGKSRVATVEDTAEEEAEL